MYRVPAKTEKARNQQWKTESCTRNPEVESMRSRAENTGGPVCKAEDRLRDQTRQCA